VDRGGRHARLSLADTRSRDRMATAGPGAATPAAASPYADRVRQIDDHTWEVDRSLVKEMVGGVTKAGGVRATPMIVDGEVKGIRLSGVAAGSIPTMFGLKSGDVLTTIDDAPLKTANQVLELYAKLDSVTQVQIGVTRAGAPVPITLQLR
jgi:C-terminal processing protease CtpA/Prc